jgi:hypothetical protein
MINTAAFDREMWCFDGSRWLLRNITCKRVPRRSAARDALRCQCLGHDPDRCRDVGGCHIQMRAGSYTVLADDRNQKAGTPDALC